MTVALLALGGALGVAGTRLAAVPFAAAAATAAASDGQLRSVGTWLAATAAGLILAGLPPRRVALPALGVAAALTAGSAGNVAGFLPAWTLGTAIAVALPLRGTRTRWSLALLGADVPVIAAALWTLAQSGFVGWPRPPGSGPAALLVAGSVLRWPLAAGPADAPEAGVLVVRAQSLVLLTVALGSSVGGAPDAATDPAFAVAALAAAGFAAAGLAVRPGHRDGTQEIALAAAALAAGPLGWSPSGWLWGVLAAGTTLHLARLSAPRTGRLGEAMLAAAAGGGLGAPLWAAGAAVAVAAAAAGGTLGAVVVTALLAGLGGRLWWVGTPRPRTSPSLPALGFLLAALAAGAGPGLLALPEALGGARFPGPELWVLALVAAGAAAGAAVPLAAGRRRAHASPRPVPWPSRWTVARPVATRVLAAATGAALALSAVLWVLGWVRGFL